MKLPNFSLVTSGVACLLISCGENGVMLPTPVEEDALKVKSGHKVWRLQGEVERPVFKEHHRKLIMNPPAYQSGSAFLLDRHRLMDWVCNYLRDPSNCDDGSDVFSMNDLWGADSHIWSPKMREAQKPFLDFHSISPKEQLRFNEFGIRPRNFFLAPESETLEAQFTNSNIDYSILQKRGEIEVFPEPLDLDIESFTKEAVVAQSEVSNCQVVENHYLGQETVSVAEIEHPDELSLLPEDARNLLENWVVDGDDLILVFSEKVSLDEGQTVEESIVARKVGFDSIGTCNSGGPSFGWKRKFYYQEGDRIVEYDWNFIDEEYIQTSYLILEPMEEEFYQELLGQ